MSNLNAVCFSSRCDAGFSKDEKKKIKTAHRINLAATGLGAAVIAGTALSTSAIYHHAERNPRGIIANVGKLVKKTFTYLNNKIKPLFTRIAEGKIGQKLKNAGKYIAERAIEFHKNTPRFVKIGTAIGVGALIMSHFYRKGAIDAGNKAYQLGAQDGYYQAHVENFNTNIANSMQCVESSLANMLKN